MAGPRWMTSFCVGLGATVLVAILGCPSDSSDERQPPPPPGGTDKLEITNDAGVAITRLDSFDSLMVSLTGVKPREHYDFVVTPAGQTSPIVGQARLSSDQQGNLPPAILLYDVGQGMSRWGRMTCT